MKAKNLIVLALFVGLSVLVSATYSFTSSFLERPGWWFYDILQQQFPAKIKDEDVILVEFDDITLAKLAEEEFGFPPPRELYVGFFEMAKAMNVRLIVFDILFDSQSTYGLEDDLAFNEAMRASGIKVVMPAPTGKVQPPYKRIIQGYEENILYGAVTPPAEVDGIYRTFPFYIEDKKTKKKYPTLGHQAVISPGRDMDITKGQDSILVHFYDISTLNRVPMYNLLKAYNDYEESGEIPDVLKGIQNKVWIVGYRALGLFDVKPMPFSPKASGVDLHLHGALNLLNEDYINRFKLSYEIYLFLFISLGSLVFLSLLKTPVYSGSIIAWASLGAPMVLMILLWQYKIWLNPFPLGIKTAAILGGFFAIRYQQEFKERSRYAKLLAHSMSKDMVELVRSGEMKVSRFGERRDITICFSDLSGFTTIAESMPAQELVELLNEYLDEVVDIIFEHDGYVDKFIGDAVMALWGAPVNGQDNHAELGLKTTLNFQKAVHRFNEKARVRLGEDCPTFIARVGLHTGEAIVGNIGSQDRHNYTAIGDSVNLAARLESLGKQYNVLTLISSDVLQALGIETHPDLICIDEVLVKGKTAPTKIYTEKLDLSEDQVQVFQQAYENYRKENWKEAVDLLLPLKEFGPSEVLLGRCELAIIGGRPKQFKDGVWIHDSK